jgi:Fur family ferric uptake transcriptional regulator
MLDESARALRAGGRRLGAARRQVIEALGRHTQPVSAEELAAELPNVHLSSVYRGLATLEELGLIRHVHLAHGPARYELENVAAESQHLVCRVCGRDVTVPDALFDELRRTIERDYGFVLDGGHFAIPGHCLGCSDTAH